jgi:hypothetical protein
MLCVAACSGTRTLQLFMEEALPQAPEAMRALAGDVIMMTLSTVGKQISEAPRTSAEIETYANAVAEMLCAYLEALARSEGFGRPHQNR